MSHETVRSDHDIENDLMNGRRWNADEVSDIPESAIGLYALFLKDDRSIAIPLDESRLIYIGMTESSFEERNHFLRGDSSFSSPRRSLGALLKSEGSQTSAICSAERWTKRFEGSAELSLRGG